MIPTPPSPLSRIVHTIMDVNGSSNSSMCDGESVDYIPTVQQYRDALGGYGTAFIAIGSVTTALLYMLFFQQVWFTFSNTHRVYRRHIYWLISIYPFVTLMSTLALVVPRSHTTCRAIKIVYMSIGVSHFADLTMLMYGSEEKMLDDLSDTPMQLALAPLCCFLRFLPTPVITKWKLRIVFTLCSQMPISQFIYYFLVIYLREAQAYSKSSFAWLSVINFISFLSGVYALNILSRLSNDKLQSFRYRAKGLAVKVLLLTVKLQAFLFDVLGNNHVFPCLGYMITPIVYQYTLENSIFLVEMIIFGLFSYFMYRKPEFKEFEEPKMLTTQSNEVDDDTRVSVIQVRELNNQMAIAGSNGSLSVDGTISSNDGPAGQLGVTGEKDGWTGLLE